MPSYSVVRDELQANPQIWLVTGVAGFIGSSLLKTLLALGQRVVGLDNFATGSRGNLDAVLAAAGPLQRANFKFLESDICDLNACRLAMQWTDSEPVHYVLHQAALGSVPRSIADPLATNRINVDGFLNILVAARDARVARVVYAASSSTYGTDPSLPKREDRIGAPLSPYAVTKLANELYADVFARNYGLDSIGLRYFNVFGPRQDPAGAYAAVIPRWLSALLTGQPVQVNGDGSVSRDFCFVENAVQANLLAAVATTPEAANQVYNIAVGQRTTLLEIFQTLRELVATHSGRPVTVDPVFAPPRVGDILHSQADITKSRVLLGYEPTHDVRQGLDLTVQWFVQQTGASPSCAT